MEGNNYLNQFKHTMIPRPKLIQEFSGPNYIYGVAFKKGMRVPSHTAPGEVYLMVSEGECELTIEEEVNHFTVRKMIGNLLKKNLFKNLR